MADKKHYDPEYTYTEFQSYKNFFRDKQKLKSKYPTEVFWKPTSGRDSSREYEEYLKSGNRELHKQYLKEIADLIFQPNGDFQQLTWDMMTEMEKLDMERISRGRKNYSGDKY